MGRSAPDLPQHRPLEKIARASRASASTRCFPEVEHQQNSKKRTTSMDNAILQKHQQHTVSKGRARGRSTERMFTHTQHTEAASAHTHTAQAHSQRGTHTERHNSTDREKHRHTQQAQATKNIHNTTTHNEQLTHTTSTHYTVHHAGMPGLSAVDHHSTQQEPPVTHARRGTHVQETHTERSTQQRSADC